MAMTEKHIKRRMDEAFDSHYKQYEIEAEWYGNDDSHIWVFDIPSKQITVKMEINEEAANGDAPKPGKEKSRSSEFDVLKKHLSKSFGVPVNMSCSANGKGKITFQFSNEAELERIIALFDTLKH